MDDQETKFGFSEGLGVDETQVGGWLVGAFRPGGTVLPGFETRGTTDITKDIKIIDVDSHFTEKGDLWTARLPESMKATAPYVKRLGHLAYWHIGEAEIGRPSGRERVCQSEWNTGV